MDQLISRLPKIYDAATAQHKWPDALDEVADIFDARGMLVYALNQSAFYFSIEAGNSFYVERDHLVKKYQSRFNHYDEHAVKVLFGSEPLTPVRDTDFWPDLFVNEKPPPR